MDYEGVERVMAKGNVTHDQAIGSLRNWWSGLFMAYDLNRQALITECQLIYAPFWKLKAKVTGRVIGYAYAIEENIELDVKIDHTYLWTGIACDIRELGVDYLRNPEIYTEPYDPYLGSIANLTITMKSAMADGRSWIEYAALKNVDVPNISFKRINVQPLEVQLIFYPLWTIKYSYFKQKYWATVDGVSGEILAGRAPGDLLLRRWALGAGITITILGAILSLWILFNISMSAAPILLLTIIVVCFTIIWIAFSFYFSDPEIIVKDFRGKFRHNLDPID